MIETTATDADMRPAIFVATYGDGTDVNNFSGTPWHVTDGLRRVGADAHALALAPPSRWGRRAHAAGQLLTTGGYGGYQYAPHNLDRMWGPVRDRVRGARVLNLFQLYAPSVMADPGVQRWFYIDATLRQLIDTFGDLPHMSVRARTALLERERDGYAKAAGVIVFSQWVADSLLRDYAIDPARVHVVLAGANLDLDRYAAWRDTAQPPGEEHGPLRLVFTGMHGVRKGLDRLLQAMRLAQANGADLALTVIGCGPDSVPEPLRSTAGVTWIGRVDKQTDYDRFITLVSGAEVGCLLSRSECSGLSQREFAAFGLALISPDTGGSADHAGRDRAVLVDPEAEPESIAEILGELATRGPLYRRLRAAAWSQRDEPLQTTTSQQLLAIMDAHH